MGRTNIFDLLANSNTIKRESSRLDTLFHNYSFVHISPQTYTLRQFVDKFCFIDWPNRSHCLDVEDFFVSLDRDEKDPLLATTIEEFLTSIEIAYNFWHMANTYIDNHLDEVNTLYDTVDIIKRLMDECLSEYNYKAYYFEDSQKCIIAEDSPQVTAAAEATEPQTAIEIVRYNHYAMKGDIARKKAILKTLSDYLEGRKSEITNINNALYNTITGALNNLNIRHNNIDPGNKEYYKPRVAEITSEELEGWYDELYQLVLLAILEIDNVDRKRKVKEIVQKVKEK